MDTHSQHQFRCERSPCQFSAFSPKFSAISRTSSIFVFWFSRNHANRRARPKPAFLWSTRREWATPHPVLRCRRHRPATECEWNSRARPDRKSSSSHGRASVSGVRPAHQLAEELAQIHTLVRGRGLSPELVTRAGGSRRRSTRSKSGRPRVAPSQRTAMAWPSYSVVCAPGEVATFVCPQVPRHAKTVYISRIKQPRFLSICLQATGDALEILCIVQGCSCFYLRACFSFSLQQTKKVHSPKDMVFLVLKTPGEHRGNSDLGTFDPQGECSPNPNPRGPAGLQFLF